MNKAKNQSVHNSSDHYQVHLIHTSSPNPNCNNVKKEIISLLSQTLREQINKNGDNINEFMEYNIVFFIHC